MARDPATDPTEELGRPLSPSERVERVFQEIKDDLDYFSLTPGDMSFLRNNKSSTWSSFTLKQEIWMIDIERRVFGEEPLKKEREDETGQTGSTYKPLDGQLKFHKK